MLDAFFHLADHPSDAFLAVAGIALLAFSIYSAFTGNFVLALGGVVGGGVMNFLWIQNYKREKEHLEYAKRMSKR